MIAHKLATSASVKRTGPFRIIAWAVWKNAGSSIMRDHLSLRAGKEAGGMLRKRATPRPVDALDGVSGFRASTSHNRRTT
jgi:hypothetical protein